MSFTADAWTCLNGQSYFGIIVHFISNDWKMHSTALDSIPALGQRTGKAIAKGSCKCLKEYQLQTKVQGITVDNAAANTTFMRELELLMIEEGYSFDHVNQNFRCLSNILNLAVQDVLQLIKVETLSLLIIPPVMAIRRLRHTPMMNFLRNIRIVKKTKVTNLEPIDNSFHPHTAIKNFRETFKKIRYSEKMQRILRNFCEAGDIKYRKPIIDTRWDSTYNMIRQSLKIKTLLSLLLSQCTELPNVD
uniref:DUF659 domain-containing protein n=1 Tax=Bracon brevicornis TaxID=1563983 RepID=A0A6V7LPB3_9HYME